MDYITWRDLTILLMMGQSVKFPFGMYKSGKDQVVELLKILEIFRCNGCGFSLIPHIYTKISNKYNDVYMNLSLTNY